jgi:hypothetical protein
MTTTAILAMIGGAALILTAAARIPPALVELLRACIPVVTALCELRTALNASTIRDDSAQHEDPAPPSSSPSKAAEPGRDRAQTPLDIRADDSGNRQALRSTNHDR